MEDSFSFTASYDGEYKLCWKDSDRNINRVAALKLKTGGSLLASRFSLRSAPHSAT
jgi:hypothetical protein